MGRPATFIRLSGCRKPYCPWCDTPQAWERGETIDIKPLLEQVAGFKNTFIVITGGEPFLQWETGLDQLEQSLIELGYTIQYETSGKTVIPATVKGHVVCSPKFIGGGWRLDPESLSRVDDFKFVVSENFQVIEEFIRKAEIPAKNVWIMPLGATRAEQTQRMPDTWKFCADHQYNFSPRLQILAFDNKRGV